MQAMRSCSALAMLFGLAVSSARAEMITPDSIAHPPGTVGSANGTPVYLNNFVYTQYKGLGINFGSGATITSLNGVSVWAPTEMLAQPSIGVAGAPPPNPPVAQIQYAGNWSGVNFVQPGTLKSAVATSLSVEIIGQQNVGIRVTYAGSKVPVGIPAYIGVTSEPNGGLLYTFPAGPGITSFSVFAPANGVQTASTPAWGVAEVSYTVASAPEPSSLVLAGLGALGLAARLGWRRQALLSRTRGRATSPA